MERKSIVSAYFLWELTPVYRLKLTQDQTWGASVLISTVMLLANYSHAVSGHGVYTEIRSLIKPVVIDYALLNQSYQSISS